MGGSAVEFRCSGCPVCWFHFQSQFHPPLLQSGPSLKVYALFLALPSIPCSRPDRSQTDSPFSILTDRPRPRLCSDSNPIPPAPPRTADSLWKGECGRGKGGWRAYRPGLCCSLETSQMTVSLGRVPVLDVRKGGAGQAQWLTQPLSPNPTSPGRGGLGSRHETSVRGGAGDGGQEISGFFAREAASSSGSTGPSVRLPPNKR